MRLTIEWTDKGRDTLVYRFLTQEQANYTMTMLSSQCPSLVKTMLLEPDPEACVKGSRVPKGYQHGN